MKRVYYAHSAWENRTLGRAVGETASVSRPEPRFTADERSKVIDMAAWKAENMERVEQPDSQAQFESLDSGLALDEGRELVRRPRLHWNAQAKGELAATVSVACVMLALLVRMLVF